MEIKIVPSKIRHNKFIKQVKLNNEPEFIADEVIDKKQVQEFLFHTIITEKHSILIS